MKFGVGVMLTSFGIFWGAEGAGANWPGGDAALLVIVPAVLAFSLALVQLFRVSPAESGGRGMSRIQGALLGFWDFIVGDDWVTAAGVVVALTLTALLSEGHAAWFVTPIAVAILLTASIWRRRGSTGVGDSDRRRSGPSVGLTTMSRP